jgi:hypothetical protein
MSFESNPYIPGAGRMPGHPVGLQDDRATCWAALGGDSDDGELASFWTR